MMFFRQQPNPGPSDTDRTAQFQALVEIIRTEIRVGVDPLRGDIATLKSAVDEVRQQQRQMYSREVMDLKLKERDDAITALRQDHEEMVTSVRTLNSTIGGFWKQAFVTAGIVLGPLSTLIVLWPKLAALFQ